ncbi:DUF4160 domain-containing protein [Phenylobacterium sp.]|uniref:DUF4160 domain-containing protein n=1 Tax=Phenylobacterium sp. TaxID=1871053 RepID=UPI003943E104
MVTLHRGAKWKIAVYAEQNHALPHFHIECPEHRSSVTIEGLSEIAGGVPKGVLKEALAWAAAHQDELRATWKELNP